MGVVLFSSFGLLINKHFCKGRQTETSVFIANKGCAKDVSILDRVFFRINDCHAPVGKKGINKKPCCDFSSVFEKISVFAQSIVDFDFIPQSFFVEIVRPISTEDYHHFRLAFVNKGPPDKGVPVIRLNCVLRI
ncbi:MAG: hypothetical protein K9G46_03125 [Flavobacteriales bacterium]|jgi:hypothetical protein|nr:hypothetical protein [Flavobacteriales bacterium]